MRNPMNAGVQKFIAISALLVVLLGPMFALPQASAVMPISGTGVIIGNGNVIMGIDNAGQLNIPYRPVTGKVGGWALPTSDPGHPSVGQVGLRNGDGQYASTEPGCLCEGWGISIPSKIGPGDPAATGYANNDAGSANLVVDSLTGSDGDLSAASTVTAFGKFQVTHDYHPTPLTPYLYQVTVTIKNIGSVNQPDVHYRRVMDWDIQPTQFHEFVTNQGVAANLAPAGRLVNSGDNGFLTSDPLVAAAPDDFEHTFGSGTYNKNFKYSGPEDHGGVFDLQVGPIKAGEAVAFNEYYGSAPDEAKTDAALAAVGATLSSKAFSLLDSGKPNTDGKNGPVFAWGFGGIAGTVLNHPPTIDPIPDQTVHVSSLDSFTAVGRDPDSDPLSYFLSGAPPGASIDPSTGDFSWKPSGGAGQSPGTYFFDVFVSDGSLTAHTTVKVIVSEFLIPESPIGILALVGTALAALGAFAVLQRRRNNNVDDYTGSFGLGV